MTSRNRPHRCASVLVVIGVVVGGVAVAASPAVAEVSDADCDVVLSTDSWDNSGADSNSEELAATAASMKRTAADIDDTKLKKGLLKMASVYDAASKKPTVKAAALEFSRRSNTWVKGYKPYAKALNECTMRSLEDSLDADPDADSVDDN